MSWVRTAVLAGIALEAVVAGVSLWGGLARAERSAPVEAADTLVAPDLFARSKGFRELLEAVRDRGAELDRRARELEAREAAVHALEATIAERLTALEAAPTATHRADTAAVSCNAAVTRIYQSMRPDEAAPIIERLDDATASAIFACMKERQIGAILAAMSRERAVAMTKLLAGGS